MIPAGRPVVAVGHSFGGLWLLHERPFAWDGLVLVNGFPRFAEGDGFAPATPRRLLDRMIARFDAAPEAVTGDFLHRCGVEAPRPEGLDAARLGAALRALRDWDARAALVGPALALAGAQDPIVPPAMTEQAVAGIDVGWHADGGHLLPLTAPGALRFGEADSNDGALRIEYRYCTAQAGACSVESVDIALRSVR